MSEVVVSHVGPLRRLWRRVAPLVVVSAFYFGVLVYPILRIRGLLVPAFPEQGQALHVVGQCGVGHGSGVEDREWRRGPPGRILGAVGRGV